MVTGDVILLDFFRGSVTVIAGIPRFSGEPPLGSRDSPRLVEGTGGEWSTVNVGNRRCFQDCSVLQGSVTVQGTPVLADRLGGGEVLLVGG